MPADTGTLAALGRQPEGDNKNHRHLTDKGSFHEKVIVNLAFIAADFIGLVPEYGNHGSADPG